MDTHRITVGLAAFGALVLVYVVYSHFNRTPRVYPREFDMPADHLVGDTNKALAEVGVEGRIIVNKPVIELRNETGGLMREMGFLDMHVTDDKNLIEVEKPYLNLFDPKFTCRVTAALGSVRFDSENKNPFPKDASFSGEVLIVFEPTPGSSFEPGTVHLDHLLFLSDQSRFSSNGAIHFESPSMEIKGTGLECVYNAGNRRIEYFWLQDLAFLRLRMPEERMFFGRDLLYNEQADRAVTHPGDPNEAPQYSFEQAMAMHYYSCRIRGNTLVRTPRQIVYAEETINLTKFLWPNSPLGAKTGNAPADVNDTASTAPASGTTSTTVAVATPLVDIVITCDRGIMIAPDDVNTAIVDPRGLAGLQPRLDWRREVDEAVGQSFFHVRDLEHELLDRNTIAHGPLELSFYTPAPLETMDKGGPILPVRIAARDMVRYDADANLILFAGDSQCALVSGEPNAVENYTLKAPRIAIELLDDKEMQAIAATTDLKHLRADGGGVTLRMTTTTQAGATAAAPGAQAITGAEMTCRECDFNPTPGQGTFEALGPGTILLNNAGAEAQTEGAFSTGDRPYYAGLKGFDTLKYHVDESIVADGHVQDMLFDYFPIIAGNVDLEQRIHVEASHVEIALIKKPTGGLELGSIRATGHVSYRDKKIDLKASGLSYDHNTQWMEMWSETDEPCYINGIPTTTIKFNLKTGELSEAEIKGPGSVPLGL